MMVPSSERASEPSTLPPRVNSHFFWNEEALPEDESDGEDGLQPPAMHAIAARNASGVVRMDLQDMREHLIRSAENTGWYWLDRDTPWARSCASAERHHPARRTARNSRKQNKWCRLARW